MRVDRFHDNSKAEGVASRRFAYRTGGDHLDIPIFAVAVPVTMPIPLYVFFADRQSSGTRREMVVAHLVDLVEPRRHGQSLYFGRAVTHGAQHVYVSNTP